MDTSYGSVKDLTIKLVNEHDLRRRLRIMELLVGKFLPASDVSNLDDEIFQFLLPAARSLITTLFEKNVEIMTEKVPNESNGLAEQLKMIVQVLQIIDLVLEFIQNRALQISDVPNVPTNVTQILYSTFMHCKQSYSLYTIFCDSAEVVKIFKMSQEVHSKLLNALEHNIQFNLDFDEQKELLLEVFDIFCDIGAVLSGMNVKSMADTWKTYTALMQMYQTGFGDDFRIEKPLAVISGEVLRNLNEIVNDPINTTQTIKVTSFLIKIAIRIFDTFWELCCQSQREVLMFFCQIYSFSAPYNRQKVMDSNLLQMINTSVFNPIEPVLMRFLRDADICEGSDICSLTEQHCIGFMIFTNVVFSKINFDTSKESTSKYLKCAFTVYKKDLEVSTHLWINGLSLYENTVVNLAEKTLSVGPAEFIKIEELLVEKLLQSNVSQAILASDIFTLVLRYVPPTLQLDVLLAFMLELKGKHFFKINLDYKLQILTRFLRNVYANMPNTMKVRVFEKYSPESFLNVWAILGFNNVPSTKNFLINTTIQNVSKRIANIDLRKSEEVLYLIDGLHMLSTISIGSSVDVQTLVDCVMKLWHFEVDFQLINGHLFLCFLTALCLLSEKLLSKLNSQQYEQVSKQLTGLQQRSDAQMRSSNAASKQDPHDVTLINPAISLLKSALKDNNPIKKPPIISESHDAGTSRTKPCASKEQLPDLPAAKKFRIEEDQARDILDRMKVEVKALMKLSAQGKVGNDCAVDIFDVVNKMKNLI